MTPRDHVVTLLRDGRTGTTGVRRPAMVLAPMATITHPGYRTLVSEFGGCDLYVTEMISAEALTNGTPFESSYRSLVPEPNHTLYQLVGYSSGVIMDAARILATEPCAGIDINMGCSAPHIVRKGGGIAWMNRPEDAARLVADLRKLLPHRTVSAKLRLGSRDDPDALRALAVSLQDAGADFLTLHPKLQKEGVGRSARWSAVEMLSSELTIPVIGNGGVTNWGTYQSRSGDPDRPRGTAVMIGRGAVRAPWLFAYLRGREAGVPELQVDLAGVLDRFLTLLEEHQPPEFWSSRARRFYPYLFSNVRFGHSIGARLGATHNYDEGRQAALAWFAEHPDRRIHTESA